MKTLEEIRNINEERVLELKDHSVDPPMILVLKRKAIRLYPNGQKIALYHSDKLGLDVSIPYSQKENAIAGVTSEETIDESVHDNMFGDYTEKLRKHYETGSTFTDHPELSKLKSRIINKYGKDAHEHLHAAAEHYLNGDVGLAARNYSKFERKINENFEEIPDENFLEEGVIHKLHHITSTKQSGTVVFKNGATASVEYPQAAHIMKLHSMINSQNKKRIEDLVNSSPAGLSRVADFAADNIK